MLKRLSPRWVIPNIVLIVLLLGNTLGVAYWLWPHFFPSTPPLINRSPDPCKDQLAPLENGIGVIQVPNSSEYYGISDGRFSFDISRPDAPLKCEGSIKLNAQDSAGAEMLWTQALQAFQSGTNYQESNDAEDLIYREDQHVLDSCLKLKRCSYINFVIGTILSGDYVGIGRDALQGAYVAQEAFNRSHLSIQVRLLIANYSSMTRTNTQQGQSIARKIADQVIQATGVDKVSGVIDLPIISQYAIQKLQGSNIPIVLSTGSSESQTKGATNIFRVAPSIEHQGMVGAMYVEHILKKRHVALFVDQDDSYSNSLATAFKEQFKADGNGNTIVVEEPYVVGDSGTIIKGVQNLLNPSNQYHPDVIYFAGNAADANTLLENLPLSTGLRVMGGDELYELGYTAGNYRRLDFTAFAFPDEPTGLNYPFLNEYRLLFAGWPPDGVYGYSRPDSGTILSFDSTLTLVCASERIFNYGSSLCGQHGSRNQPSLLEALISINITDPIQGFSGQIAFGPDGNAVDKAVVFLCVDKNDHTQFSKDMTYPCV